MQHWQMQGYAPDEAAAQVSREANAIFDTAEAAGFNPAQLIYMKAQEAGYKPKAAEKSDAEKITHLAAAQKQTQGVSTAGGAAQKGELTLAQLADMSEAELAKLDPAVKAKAMGA